MTDPTGTTVGSEVALFEKDGGTWRKVRDVKTQGVAKEAKGRWTPGAVVFETAVMKPTDARCCATGRKRYSVAL